MVVPEAMSYTVDEQQFLLLEANLPGKEEKVLGFSSPTMLETMMNWKSWFVDSIWDIPRETL